MIYRESHPFCKIKEHELKQMQKLSDQKKGFDVMLKELKPPTWQDRLIRLGCFREYNLKRMELIRELGFAVCRKEDWWKKIRVKYEVPEGKPAIVNMRTGHILLGEPKV